MTPDYAEPLAVAHAVETFVDDCHTSARGCDNVELLDEDQVYDLHLLAARIYAQAFEDGRFAERTRQHAADRRRREASDD